MAEQNRDADVATLKEGVESRDYFCDRRATEAFNSGFAKWMGEQQRGIVAKYMRRENTQRFNHGGGWTHPASSDASDGELKLHSAEFEAKFEDLAEHDLQLIDRLAGQLLEQMEAQFARTLYATVSEAAKRVGNTVEARGTDLAEAFYKAIETVQFSADRDEKVSRPDLHMHPDMAKRMMAALEAAPPEFRARLEELTERKTNEAIERERERKAKFVTYKKTP